MDSTLVVQQFIQQQICHDPANVAQILTPPDSQDEGVWKYEHLRQVFLRTPGTLLRPDLPHFQLCDAAIHPIST